MKPKTVWESANYKIKVEFITAVNAEIKDLFAAGADIVQIDEPYMQARPEKARQSSAVPCLM